MRTRALLYAALFLAGAGVRAIDLWHPVDGSIREAWRECDYASIARNYYREDPRFLYPRIDWRGDGPGFAEMEFPATPWLTAQLYRVAGFHEEAGRVLVYAFALGALAAFFALAARLLPPGAALGASLFFTLSPLAVRISNTLQPEGLMFMAYVLAVYGFVRWLDTDRWSDFALTAAATALTVLAKASTAHLGLLFVFLLWKQGGWPSFRRLRVWALGVLSLAPAALWYGHARGFWHQYGNSLGLSNEYHWIGWDFFTNPYFVRGIAASELFYVWMPAGVFVAALGIAWRHRDRATQLGLAWFAAAAAFYVVASRTTADAWADYYHVLSVPSAALLFGSGIAALAGAHWKPRPLAAALMALAGAALVVLMRRFGVALDYHTGPRPLLLLVALVAGFVALAWRSRAAGAATAEATGIGGRIVVTSLCALAPLTVFMQVNRIAVEAHPRYMAPAFACARQFAPLIPPGKLVLQGGSNCSDEDGYPVAHNESFMFYWLDRKGFNICTEEQSVHLIERFRARGAAFYLVARTALAAKPGFEHALRAAYPAVAACDRYVLFRLSSPAGAARRGAPQADRESGTPGP